MFKKGIGCLGYFGVIVLLIAVIAIAWTIIESEKQREIATIYYNAAEAERRRAEADQETAIALSEPLVEREKWAGETALQRAVSDGRVSEIYAQAFIDTIRFQQTVTLESLHFARTGYVLMETKHDQEIEIKEVDHRHYMERSWLIVISISLGILFVAGAATMDIWIPYAIMLADRALKTDEPR